MSAIEKGSFVAVKLGTRGRPPKGVIKHVYKNGNLKVEITSGFNAGLTVVLDSELNFLTWA